jgi:hypothetical protein
VRVCVWLTANPVPLTAQAAKHVREGHQVMVFVHARNATGRIAQALRVIARKCVPALGSVRVNVALLVAIAPLQH